MSKLETCKRDDHTEKSTEIVVVYDGWELDECPLCAALTKIYDLENKIEELEAEIKDLKASIPTKEDEHDELR